jgi:hypothetical protein
VPPKLVSWAMASSMFGMSVAVAPDGAATRMTLAATSAGVCHSVASSLVAVRTCPELGAADGALTPLILATIGLG